MKSFIGKADLHIHSKYSRDSYCSIENIFRVADKKKLNLISITDHNTIKGHKEAEKIVSNFKVKLIKGEEIGTKQGHLIGLFIDSFIPPERPIIDTIREIHNQGGLAIVSHPCSILQHGISLKTLLKIYQELDGIELYNSIAYFCGSFKDLKTIKSDFKKLNLAAIGSSDAHILAQIGLGYTLFKGKEPKDLFFSIKNRLTEAKGDANFSTYLKLLIKQPRFLVKKIFNF